MRKTKNQETSHATIGRNKEPKNSIDFIPYANPCIAGRRRHSDAHELRSYLKREGWAQETSREQK